MKIKFLGTAAAEGIPGMFCECETCRKSRELGGKNIRTRSQALVDGKILIDFPADTYHHMLVNGIELSKIHTCLITHAHSDHLYERDLWCRGGGIGYMENPEPLTMYAAENGYRKMAEYSEIPHLIESKRVRLKKVVPFVPFEAEGYRIIPLEAFHDEKSSPVMYILQKDGKSMLYAHDTGYFPEKTVDYLKNSGICFDFVSFDCTGGLNQDDNYGIWGHLNLICVNKTRDMLVAQGNITEKTVCVVNHFSHNGTPIFEEMEAEAKKYGYLTSYDGFEVEF